MPTDRVSSPEHISPVSEPLGQGTTRSYLNIRRRVIVFGIVLSLIAFWLVVRMEQVDQTGLPTGLGIYFHAVVILAGMAFVNTWVRRRFPQHAVNRAELLCLYSMMSVASSFACWEMLGTHLDAISVPTRWLALNPLGEPIAGPILRFLPGWSLLRDPVSALQLYNGRHGSPLDWHGWLLPLIAWGALLAVTQAMAAAGCRVLYDRWAHQEKLSFPLTALPLEISDPESHVWRTKAFRLGLTLAFGLDLMNGLHQFIPALPQFNDKVTFLNQAPMDTAWQAVGDLPVTGHPLMLGIAFLLPTDLLFSCWFFYVIGKFQLYWAGAMNLAQGSPYEFGHNVPGLMEQNTGAMLVFGITTLQGAYRSLVLCVREAWQGNPILRRDIGILVGGTVIWALVLLNLGVSWPLIPLFLVVALLISLVVLRFRAEMGLPVHNLQGQGPEMLLGVSLGPQETSLRSLTGLMALHGLFRSQQGSVMPHQLEGAYMADRVNAQPRRYWAAIGIAGLVAAMLGPWIFVSVVSSVGLNNHSYNPFPEEGWRQLAQWAYHPSPPDIRTITEMGVGALVMWALTLLRYTWLGSPFHPLGYAICGGWGLSMVVTPLFLAWLVKTPVMRYGGLGLYRKLVPLAYGLIMGEFIAAVFWAILSIILHVPTYSVWLF